MCFKLGGSLKDFVDTCFTFFLNFVYVFLMFCLQFYLNVATFLKEVLRK